METDPGLIETGNPVRQEHCLPNMNLKCLSSGHLDTTAIETGDEFRPILPIVIALDIGTNTKRIFRKKETSAAETQHLNQLLTGSMPMLELGAP
ncbi:unnamed protein product [Nezara viridula]|uniref:Uncharacterized protein n=1 Tax=Nezara viridula TaxID=85310 RepID=A0A9P0MRK1_NEZVI|nr:unnamed protein product [Nezara viridula]